MIVSKPDVKYKNMVYESWLRDGELELRMCNNDRSRMFRENPLLPEDTVYIHVIRQLEKDFRDNNYES